MSLGELINTIEHSKNTPGGPMCRSLSIGMIGMARAESDATLDDQSVLAEMREAVQSPFFRDRLIRRTLYGVPNGAKDRMLSVLLEMGLSASDPMNDGSLEYTQPEEFVDLFAQAAAILQAALGVFPVDANQ